MSAPHIHPVVFCPDAQRAASEQSAIDFARHVAEMWDRVLGRRLLGSYLIGSLAHGGFGARYSDIDLALIAEAPIASGELQSVQREAAACSPALAAKLSLFWADRYFAAGRFPPLDRVDYLDHAVALGERERICPTRPTLGEVRAYLRAEPFRNWSQQVERLSVLTELEADDRKRYLRALLYPARLLYSFETGAVASNDVAVAFLKSRAYGLDLDLIGRALHLRNAGLDPDPIFSERAKLVSFRDICGRRIAGE
jgi:hypothetical protein